jgi:O-antigen/teichoic acid export membrane protein
MILASSLGFIKILVLAYVLPKEEYGLYISFFGVAAFSYLILTFGSAEKTIKKYPRRWVDGQRSQLISDSINECKLLTFRFVFAALIFLVLLFIDVVSIGIITVLLVTVLGACNAYLAFVGSLYRASGFSNELLKFTLFRSSATFGLTLLLGLQLGWEGAMLGEIIGNLLSVGMAYVKLSKIFIGESYPLENKNVSFQSDNGHFQIYFSNLALSPQSTLDKFWISNAIGPAAAGVFGVVMLIPQAAQLLGNVIVQYLGPSVIKLIHVKQISTKRSDTIFFNFLILLIFSFLITLLAFWAKHLPYFNYLFEKYDISDTSLLLAGLIGCSQIYGLIEFHLIARNREKDIMIASLFSLFVFIFGFIAASFMNASVEWFLLGVVFARFSQLFLLGRAYRNYA